MPAGIVITCQLKLAEAKHCPGSADLLLNLCRLFESFRSLGVLVVIVVKSAEKPPTFGPCGAKRDCLAVQSDSLVDFVGFTCGSCCRRDRIEILRSRRSLRHRCHLLSRRGSWSCTTLGQGIHRARHQTGKKRGCKDSRRYARQHAASRITPGGIKLEQQMVLSHDTAASLAVIPVPEFDTPAGDFLALCFCGDL